MWLDLDNVQFLILVLGLGIADSPIELLLWYCTCLCFPNCFINYPGCWFWNILASVNALLVFFLVMFLYLVLKNRPVLRRAESVCDWKAQWFTVLANWNEKDPINKSQLVLICLDIGSFNFYTMCMCNWNALVFLVPSLWFFSVQVMNGHYVYRALLRHMIRKLL